MGGKLGGPVQECCCTTENTSGARWERQEGKRHGAASRARGGKGESDEIQEKMKGKLIPANYKMMCHVSVGKECSSIELPN